MLDLPLLVSATDRCRTNEAAMGVSADGESDVARREVSAGCHRSRRRG